VAFNLQARLSLDGNSFVQRMRRVQNATERANRAVGNFRDSNNRLRNSLGQFTVSADRSTRSLSGFGRSVGGALKGVGSLTSGIYGLVGAYAAVAGAQKAFNATIGEAAKYEQSTIMIRAMMNDAQKAKEYMDLVDSFSINSPIMDSQSMLANSKSFITASKDINQLEKMWSLAERMAAIDPYQGVEGAVFALRELFSGLQKPIVSAMVRMNLL
jgi:phage tail tape-measure protein